MHAQDRFWEMDFRRHVTAGRLSEMFGASQVPTDTFIRTLGWRDVAEQEVKLLDKTSLRYYQDYADGVNAYLNTHSGAELSLEYAVLGLQNPGYSPEPWTPADSVAWLKAMAWDLRSNLEDEIDRALLSPSSRRPRSRSCTRRTRTGSIRRSPPRRREPVGDHARREVQRHAGRGRAAGTRRDPSAAARRHRRDTGRPTWTPAAYAGAARRSSRRRSTPPHTDGPGGQTTSARTRGSSSGAHTASGKPLLANDPHLGAAMPSVWYQVGLHCRAVDARSARSTSPGSASPASPA